MLLKTSIVLIVLQGLILELMLAFVGPHAQAHSSFNADQQAQRIYCEYCIAASFNCSLWLMG
jgi:hypothetical protein